MATIPERIAALRAAMEEQGVFDYIVPSADEHLNEYLPRWRGRREFMSGFDGSAGDLLIGRDDAWLYADGRYHLQAETQLANTGVQLMRVGTAGAKGLVAHLEERARKHPGLVVGIDPMAVPLQFAENLRRRIERHGASLREVSGNLVDPIWTDRPEPVRSQLLALPPHWTGRTATEKVDDIREDLKKVDAESVAVVKLDQIAWLLNLRSHDDIPYNPVFESFLYLDRESVHLFLRGADARLPNDVEAVPGLSVHEYADWAPFVSNASGKVVVDPAGTTLGVASALEAAGCDVHRMLSPLERRKAHKNPVEQDAMIRANLRASVAKTRALLWLKRAVAAGGCVTESGFRDKIESLYREQEDYFGLSFNTIAATGRNAAIIHYGECDETPLEAGHLFLIDSGAHIAGGTTDDTRTVAVGTCDGESKKVYTLVLKAHINAARQTIPDGAGGAALDALCRAPMWNAGLNYDHGTGHGVGAFLCVHEGPFAIAEKERRQNATHPLSAGIISSIEPGYYRPGWGGVRIENLYLYRQLDAGPDGRKWLQLDPVTWIPFDPALIDDTLLETPERQWIAWYHGECVKRLSPHLPDDERAELEALVS